MARDTLTTLFDSVSLNETKLQNRAGLAPMTRVSATDDGHVTDQMVQYYRRFAEGGFSFLLTEGVHPDDAHSQGYDNQPGLATDEQVDSWKAVTDAVHDAGTPIFAQLMHAGALSQGNRYVDESIAPSPVTPKNEQLEMYGGSGSFPTPRGMSRSDIDAVVRNFVEAAENARSAGFDGVEIHGANGYLLDQFLTEYTNQRDDEYGGSVENRVRFPAEVLEAVRDAVPEEFVVGVRVSQSKVNDAEYRWSGGEDDAEVVFDRLSEAGADYVHVTEEDVTTPAFESGPALSELAARHGDAPVVSNGGLEDPEAAAESITEHGADLFTLAKGALANPDWPDRVRTEQSLDEFDFQAILQPDATISASEVSEA